MKSFKKYLQITESTPEDILRNTLDQRAQFQSGVQNIKNELSTIKAQGYISKINKVGEIQAQGESLSTLWQKYKNAKGTPGERAAFDAWNKAQDQFLAASDKRNEEYRRWRDERAEAGSPWAIRSKGREERESIKAAGQNILDNLNRAKTASTKEERDEAFSTASQAMDDFDASVDARREQRNKNRQDKLNNKNNSVSSQDEVPPLLAKPEPKPEPKSDEVPPLLARRLSDTYKPKTEYYKQNPDEWEKRLQLAQKFIDTLDTPDPDNKTRKPILDQIKELDSRRILDK